MISHAESGRAHAYEAWACRTTLAAHRIGYPRAAFCSRRAASRRRPLQGRSPADERSGAQSLVGLEPAFIGGSGRRCVRLRDTPYSDDGGIIRMRVHADEHLELDATGDAPVVSEVVLQEGRCYQVTLWARTAAARASVMERSRHLRCLGLVMSRPASTLRSALSPRSSLPGRVTTASSVSGFAPRTGTKTRDSSTRQRHSLPCISVPRPGASNPNPTSRA